MMSKNSLRLTTIQAGLFCLVLTLATACSPVAGQVAEDADFDSDGVVGFDDFLAFAGAFGSTEARFDLSDNGKVDFDDFLLFAGFFGDKVEDGTSSDTAWRSIGPGQFGAMFGVAISPHDSDVIAAGTDMGNAFMTRDGGETWRILGRSGGRPFANPGYRGVWGVTFDPIRPDWLWIGSEHGLYRSTDGGDSWAHVLGGGADHTISAITTDPTDSDIVYTATGRGARTAVSWATGDIWKSADGGETWQALDVMAPDQKKGLNWTTIAIDPQSDFEAGRGHARLYACGQAGLFVSEDAGDTWRSLATSLPGGEVNLDPGGVFDSGVSTLALMQGAEQSDLYVTLKVREGDVGGVYASEDGGSTWSARNRGLEDVLSNLATVGTFRYVTLKASRRDSSVMYLSARQGVFKTGNLGWSWAKVTDLQTEWWDGPDFDGNEIFWLLRQHGGNFDQSYYNNFGPANGLACSPTDVDAVAFTDNAGIGVSFDGGANWTEPGFEFGEAFRPGAFGDRPPMVLTHRVRSRGIQVIVPYAAAFDPFDPQTIAVGYADNGLMISRDGGTWWEWGYDGVLVGEKNYIRAVLYDPDVKDRMWIGGGGWSGTGHVYQSDDGGRTFQVIVIPQMTEAVAAGGDPIYVHAIAVDPGSSTEVRTLFAGTDEGLYVTVDGGETWTQSDLSAGSVPTVLDVALDVTHSRLYAAADFDDPSMTGLYRSDDGGETWSRLAEGHFSAVRSIAVCEQTGDLYLLAQGPDETRGYWSSQTLWEGKDGGAAWDEVPIPGENATLIAVHPDDSQRLYVSTFTADVSTGDANLYRSDNGGETWLAIGDDVPLVFGSGGNRIVFDSNDAKRFLTLYSSGVYEVIEE